jgi:hypothetical protein
VNVQAAIDVITAAINQEHLAAPVPKPHPRRQKTDGNSSRSASSQPYSARGGRRRQQGDIDAFSRVM